MYIPYGHQSIDNEDIQAVVETLKSDFLTTGPKVAEFEKVVASYVGAKYAVAVSNGTAALHAACYAAGIGKGDEVITTPITFAASANCALYCGAKPVFADIDADTYNIDPEDIERKITKRTKAIIAVHFTGQPCDMDMIHKIARNHNLVVIEDGAHALGADYKGKKIGSLSDMTTFSFHPVKHITTGEGGMVVTNNKELYNRLILFRSHGITRDATLLSHNEGPWYYEQLDLGYNYRITDIQCSLGISQMKKLDKFLLRRREVAKRYDNAFADNKNIKIPYQLKECNNSYHLYTIQVLNYDRRQVFDKLRSIGIGVNVHYIPIYKFPYYRDNGYKDIICNNAENYYEHCISIPIFYGLTDKEQEFVIDNINDLCR
ncbi:UDP-4-amino-4,6-dideoxy-N-acetyl-beta-L-altrosamine transaminase [Anaerosporobacter faecicola]|uniref:UDP-4-amino-4, 6-dideoxy-N-acetyl-beta-L-altrosamine transaminase n=1 Tax=Anaerosporobacter faecicola TaxID=2718714 RepID=UPI0014398EB7|nr:UDP-4-amino-4,6-dideoxy-N-acetyl-beta-L-altrosamine transaminase [Anaerosporobacter faecicola]